MESARLMPFAFVSLMIAVACDDREGSREAGTQAEQPYSFTTLEYPGATTTVASDVADDGRVVGWYTTGDITRGFIYRNGEYTSVEYPDAVLTHVTGIGTDGSLVGAYRKAGEPGVAWHGFLRRPTGEFVDVRHPDHPHSMAQRILDDGTIFGCYHADDYTTTMRAITVSGDEIAVREMPGSMHNGGTPDGRRVVGMLAAEGRAFIADGDRITHLEAPGSTSTEAWDINASGVVVGVMVDSAQLARGYVLDNGRWTTVQVPESRSTVAFGINARGEIAGGWEDAMGNRRGYVAVRR